MLYPTNEALSKLERSSWQFTTTFIARSSRRRYLTLKKSTSMPLEDFTVEQELGKGSFGTVHKCRRKADGLAYAIKQVCIWLTLGAYGQAQIEGSCQCPKRNSNPCVGSASKRGGV